MLNQRSNVLTTDNSAEVAFVFKFKHGQGQFVIHGQRDGRHVHNPELLCQNFHVTGALD